MMIRLCIDSVVRRKSRQVEEWKEEFHAFPDHLKQQQGDNWKDLPRPDGESRMEAAAGGDWGPNKEGGAGAAQAKKDVEV